MARHQLTGRRCTFETLEDRQMLAGTVTAKIVNGNLIIKGDSSDNQITITKTGTTATVTGQSGTAIVKTPDPLINFTGRIEVNLKGGNDKVTVNGPMTITGFESENNETVIVNDSPPPSGTTNTVTVNGKVEMEDVKTLTVVNLTVNGKTELEGTSGVDTWNISGSTFNGSLESELGKGNDILNFTGSKVTGKAEFETGAGMDNVTIGASGVSTTFGSLDVDLGKDNDTLRIDDTTVTKKTELDGGSGTNTFGNFGNNFGPKPKIKHF